MSKRYDDDFFDDLDKTTDLLKAFKPHIDTKEELDGLDALYNEFNTAKKKKQENVNIDNSANVHSSYNIDTLKNTISRDKSGKQDIKGSVNKENKNISIDSLGQKRQITKRTVPAPKKKPQEKTDISEIIGKMHTTVEKSKKLKKESVSNEVSNKEIKRKKKNQFNFFEKAFITCSILFIFGCILVYGYRFFKSNISKENDKQSLMLLTTAIVNNSSVVDEGDGLYVSKDEYMYKGRQVNNYIMFSNMQWRIIKTNSDGTMDLVLDDYINSLRWNKIITSYTDSDIHKYLNDYFAEYLDKSYLTTTIICKDIVNSIEKYSCNTKDKSSYVRLLTVEEYSNSKTDSSYMADATDNLWLSTISADKVWQIHNNSLVLGAPSRALGIKPVIRLKSGVKVISGNGSQNNPYVIEEGKKEIRVGDYITLGKDRYIVYDMEDSKLSLVLDGVLPNSSHFSLTSNIYNPSDSDSLAFYLNNTYYNSLMYKDLLIEKDWNIGIYTYNYKDVTNNKVRAKVGLYSIVDLKFNNELQGYYLINGGTSGVYLYGNALGGSNQAISHSIRPAICIEKREIANGDGSLEKPYILID